MPLGADIIGGKALLRELKIHATREPLVYSHAWQPGDVVFWNNRTTIQGDMPY